MAKTLVSDMGVKMQLRIITQKHAVDSVLKFSTKKLSTGFGLCRDHLPGNLGDWIALDFDSVRIKYAFRPATGNSSDFTFLKVSSTDFNYSVNLNNN